AGGAPALAGCVPTGGGGYVEIRTMPGTTNVSQPSIYFDSIKGEPVRKGGAVLTQRVGTTKHAADGPRGQLKPCESAVKKNRITTVTVTVLERPPRCQCRNAGGSSRTCIS